MSTPTITLCLIVKNEKHNLPILFESVKDCFDEIHVTDTGSTDGTLELLENWICDISNRPCGSGTKLIVKNFEWAQDFSAARNYSIKDVTTDYWCWLDADDSLSDRGAFITWKNQVMSIADYWMATYQYASTPEGHPICSFARERVMKTSKGFKFEYFLHEGCKPIDSEGNFALHNYVPAWKVIHRRDQKDLEQDRGRNLGIFERHKTALDARMKFYYGKELFETQKPLEAYEWLTKAIIEPNLELHDRILGIQYVTFCCQQLGQWDKSIDFALQGLHLAPSRAEFFVAIADALLKQNKVAEAIPYYEAAKNCKGLMPNATIQGPLFTSEEIYKSYPRTNVARAYFAIGDMKKAIQNATEAFDMKPTPETEGVLKELTAIVDRMDFSHAEQCEDIVISCHPNGPFEWDEKLFEEKGCGGSETAAIQMAKNLKGITGRPVKVFNNRSTPFIAGSGVEYLPADQIPDYMKKFKPKLHVAWRHTHKITDAKTAVWAHDLFTPGSEQNNFDEFMCLSPFHSDLSQTMGGVKKEKVFLTRNGILPEGFELLHSIPKNPNKFVYVSSPDRGLIDLIPILDEVKERGIPGLELHVFYGIEKLPMYGPEMSKLHDRLKAMIQARPWIKYHGFTEQKKMQLLCADAAIWCHPATFIETFCISALEVPALGVYPITRRLGALPDTLKDIEANGMATLLDHGGASPEEREAYVQAILKAHDEKAWERVSILPNKYSWESVAQEWVKHFDL